MPSPALARRLLSELPLLPGALCAGKHDDLLWFPAADTHVVDERIKRLCHRCPALVKCLGWGIVHDEPGVWGGLNRYERRQLGRARPRSCCPICGGNLIWLAHETGTEICVGCGASWAVGDPAMPSPATARSA